MTWVEALPTSAVIIGLIWAAVQSRVLDKHMEYRGMFDKRVNWGDLMNVTSPDSRLAERDTRLGLYPTHVEWVHPIWRPENYPEN